MPAAGNKAIARQHLIDPEICIRCNTCEATCPVGAITHDDRNYVVRFDQCNACGACISPCPTGAIDNWRQVIAQQAYSIEEQFSWGSLPEQQDIDIPPGEELPEDILRLTSAASAGQGGATKAPWSAERAYVGLFDAANPAVATVSGNHRLTCAGAASDVRHIVLDFGATAFPVIEGQTIGILPPGVDAHGKPHYVRLYSIASPRDGERPKYNNVSLTVKRVTVDHEGNAVDGVCSNYLCDLRRGDQVRVVGPYGQSFLMPNHPDSSLMMICTGTGSAPMRAMTERRRRRMALKEGGDLLLFFGARTQQELPYFGPLTKLPKDFIDVNLAYSRVPGQPKTYVQDLIRKRSDRIVQMLADENCYIYICGLKGMESGVIEAFRDACRAHGMDWDELHPMLLEQNRFHVETY